MDPLGGSIVTEMQSETKTEQNTNELSATLAQALDDPLQSSAAASTPSVESGASTPVNALNNIESPHDSTSSTTSADDGGDEATKSDSTPKRASATFSTQTPVDHAQSNVNADEQSVAVSNQTPQTPQSENNSPSASMTPSTPELATTPPPQALNPSSTTTSTTTSIKANPLLSTFASPIDKRKSSNASLHSSDTDQRGSNTQQSRSRAHSSVNLAAVLTEQKRSRVAPSDSGAVHWLQLAEHRQWRDLALVAARRAESSGGAAVLPHQRASASWARVQSLLYLHQYGEIGTVLELIGGFDDGENCYEYHTDVYGKKTDEGNIVVSRFGSMIPFQLRVIGASLPFLIHSFTVKDGNALSSKDASELAHPLVLLEAYARQQTEMCEAQEREIEEDERARAADTTAPDSTVRPTHRSLIDGLHLDAMASPASVHLDDADSLSSLTPEHVGEARDAPQQSADSHDNVVDGAESSAELNTDEFVRRVVACGAIGHAILGTFSAEPTAVADSRVWRRRVDHLRRLVATVFVYAHQYAVALKQLRPLVKATPTDHTLLYWCGRIRVRLGDIDGARHYFEAARRVELGVNDDGGGHTYWSLLHAGVLAMADGKYGDACDLFDSASSHADAPADALGAADNNRSVALVYMGNLTRAITHLEYSLSLSPRHRVLGASVTNLALMYDLSGERVENRLSTLRALAIECGGDGFALPKLLLKEKRVSSSGGGGGGGGVGSVRDSAGNGSEANSRNSRRASHQPRIV